LVHSTGIASLSMEVESFTEEQAAHKEKIKFLYSSFIHI